MLTANQEHLLIVKEDRRSRRITNLVLLGMFCFAIATIVACTLLAQGPP